MNCQDFRELIDSYLSDELLTETNHALFRHMENCAGCRDLIRARRQVRASLKLAVRNAPQFQIGKNFEQALKINLKREALGREKSGTGFFGWLKFNPGFSAAAAAGVAVILIIAASIFLTVDFENRNAPASFAKNSHVIETLPANHLTNIALGDHEFCAVGHDDDEPVTLAATPAKFEKIDGVVALPVENSFSRCELVSSHSCRYKNTDFKHLIFKNGEKTLSVLLTDAAGHEGLPNGEISNLASTKYRVARFDLKEGAVFVISDLDEEKNSKAARSIVRPLRDHFGKSGSFAATKAVFLNVY